MDAETIVKNHPELAAEIARILGKKKRGRPRGNQADLIVKIMGKYHSDFVPIGHIKDAAKLIRKMTADDANNLIQSMVDSGRIIYTGKSFGCVGKQTEYYKLPEDTI